jgi:hypothetical protein
LIFFARIQDIRTGVNGKLIVEGNYITDIGYTKNSRKVADYYQIGTNSVATDGLSWSFSTADQVTIGVRPATLRFETLPSNVNRGKTHS